MLSNLILILLGVGEVFLCPGGGSEDWLVTHCYAHSSIMWFCLILIMTQRKTLLLYITDEKAEVQRGVCCAPRLQIKGREDLWNYLWVWVDTGTPAASAFFLLVCISGQLHTEAGSWGGLYGFRWKVTACGQLPNLGFVWRGEEKFGVD